MKAVCDTCMHRCVLEEGQYGLCGARKNEGGQIACKNYGRITALALDPIEKKPLRMFYPGSLILSAGSFGCNLKCPFCQNHEISMCKAADARTVYLSPGELADRASACRRKGNIGAAFTYNEPLTGWEYVRDAAKLIRHRGMKNVLVTNGCASLPVLEELIPYIDAMNIDLKGFREDYYRKLGGSLETVKAFIRRAAQECHVELSTLIVPGENDSEAQMREEAQWIASVNQNIVLHVTRFFPRCQMAGCDATDVQAVYRLADTAREYVEHVFTGNC